MSKFILYITLLLSTYNSIAQTKNPHDEYLFLSYDQVLQLAQEQSPMALATRISKDNSYWSYQSFKANYRPQLVLSTNLPGLSKGYALTPQPDGSEQSKEINRIYSTLSLSAKQLFAQTGGELFIKSDLTHSDSYTDVDPHDFQSTPIGIGYSQPLFRYNKHKTDLKLEEIKYDESLKNFIYSLEEISISATNQFFNLMVAQIQKDIAFLNLQNNDTIFKIAKGRFELGKIAENEYLQIELQYLTSEQNFRQAELDIKNTSLALKNFLGIKDERDIILHLPELTPSFTVDPQLALQKAQLHRPEMLAFERRLLEAQSGVKEARSNSGFNANLDLGYGLSASASDINELLTRRTESQTASVHLSVPILDWGRSKSQRKLAEANLELVQYNLEQEMVNFEQEILTQVNYFLQTRQQIKMAKKTDEIAQKRYHIAKKRYMIGKISITDINIATQEKDQSKITYINSLKNYWIAYYQLRKLTMYDFMLQSDLIPTHEESN